jgi:hypothetical protein
MKILSILINLVSGPTTHYTIPGPTPFFKFNFITYSLKK